MRMGLDYVDVLLLHWPDEKTPLQESIEAMAHLKKQGKVRFIGAVSYTHLDVYKRQSRDTS